MQKKQISIWLIKCIMVNYNSTSMMATATSLVIFRNADVNIKTCRIHVDRLQIKLIKI